MQREVFCSYYLRAMKGYDFPTKREEVIQNNRISKYEYYKEKQKMDHHLIQGLQLDNYDIDGNPYGAEVIAFKRIQSFS